MSEFDDILNDIDLDTATTERKEIWIWRLKRALEREIEAERKAKPKKCSRPSCTRAAKPLFSHCCVGCLYELGHVPADHRHACTGS